MRRTILVLLALCLGWTGSAGAAVVTYSTGFFSFGDTVNLTGLEGDYAANFGIGPGFQSLPGFDSSLGTLTGVSVSINYSLLLSAALQANDDRGEFDLIFPLPFPINERNDVQGTARVQATVTTQIFNPASAADVYTTALLLAACSGGITEAEPIACDDAASQTFTHTANISLDSVDLSLFEAVDPIQFYSITQGQVTGSCGPGDLCAVNAGLNGMNASFGVTYTYTPVNDPGNGGNNGGNGGTGGNGNTVPEPGALALLGAASLAAAGALRRARRTWLT